MIVNQEIPGMGTSAVRRAGGPEASPAEAAADDPGHALPDEPIVRIRPSRSWVALNLRDVWGYRELLYLLTWRDVQVRYKQTVMGVAWAVIQPLASMLIFNLFFGRLAKLPSDGIPYPLFAFAGLLPWTFFSNAVTNSGNSLVGSAHLITKVYFPRMIIPAATVGAGLVDLAIAFVLLAGLMAYYGVAVGWGLLMLPVVVALTVVLALGVGLWTSALNVKYRDVRYALPFLTQLWMFASPVIYPASLVPDRWRPVMALNPMTGVIEGYRSSLFGLPFDWPTLGISAAVTLALFTFAAYSFRRMERAFADVV
jgi:lipopolysaccharide transport system permease protein